MISEKVTPWYVLNSPETGQPFQDFYDACTKGSVLDTKTRELLMLSLASAFRCPHCTEAHIKAAIEAGVTKEEITEALLIAAVEGVGTQLNWAREVYLKYLGNKKRTYDLTQVLYSQAIAGGGFEPPTSGLWARRATRLLYPAVIQEQSIPLNCLFSKNKTVYRSFMIFSAIASARPWPYLYEGHCAKTPSPVLRGTI